ncbi:MAG: aldo/keto reductase [Candidatus Lokiarchaeota archaeon]
MSLTLNSKVELNNGIKMPYFGLGTWKNKGKSVIDSVKWALDIGYRMIDTATLYGNEKEIGKAISSSNIPREEIFITSKVWDSDQGYEKTKIAFRRSLKALQTDYLDLYLIHWPRNLRNETWRAMQEIYKEGKVKAIGVANFAIHHLEELLEKYEVIPAVNQVEFSPFLYRKELLEFCRENNIQFEAYSPLTHGRKLDDTILKEIAKKYNKSTAQVLIRWGLQHNIIEIPKSSSKEHIEENALVFDFELSKEDMKTLNTLDETFRLLYDTSTWD